MASRVFWRRSATAAWVYASVVLGIVGTVIATRVLGLEDFGVYVTALAAVGFFQVLLDLTVEEPLAKFGFRYVVAEDWGKLRRLFVRALQLKVAGGILAALALAALAPAAEAIFGSDELTAAILMGSLLPLVQAPENVGATALLLRRRYDLRGAYLTFAMSLRLVAIAIGAPFGVTETIAAMVVAQAIATIAVSVVGLAAFRRFPSAPSRPLAEDRPEVRLVRRSSRASARGSSRSGRRSCLWCSASWPGRRRSASSASRRRRRRVSWRRARPLA